MTPDPPSGARPGPWSRLDRILHEGFADEDSPLYRAINGFIVLLIFFSVVSVTLASVPSIYDAHQRFFEVSEAVVVALFSIEYLINIYVAENRARYVFGVWGVIDLLAILPSLLLMFDLRALKVARVLRVLRFLRLMRILRVLKLAKVASRQAEARRDKLSTLKMDVQIYFIALISAVTILSTLEFYAEEHVPNTPFTSIPQAMWWCFATITTTGYGDISPSTVAGRIIAIITMLVGLALFALLVNVVGKAMLSALFGTSDLERHDEAARHGAELLAARRRHGRQHQAGAGHEEPDAVATLVQRPLACACGRSLEPDWRLCPFCGTPR